MVSPAIVNGMHHPPTLPSKTFLIPSALWLSLLLLAAGSCTGDRPVFGQRINTNGDDGGSSDTGTPAAANLDADATSEVHDSGESTVDNHPVDGADAVASHVEVTHDARDGSTPDDVDGAIPEGGAFDVTTSTNGDSAVDGACNETIASGAMLEGTTGTLGASGIDPMSLLYLPEPQIYAVASAGPGLRLATFDEQGNVVTKLTSVVSPALDESSVEMSPKMAWNGSTLGVFLRANEPEEGEAYVLGLTLALDGTVLSERRWPLNAEPDHGFELAAVNGQFLGFWHLITANETLSVVQRLDAELQPVGSTWQPLAAEPWLPHVSTRGAQVALTRGTRDNAQLHVLSDSLEPMLVASIDEPNSATPLVVGTSKGYGLAWNRSNQQVRFAQHGNDGAITCGPVLLSEEPRDLAAITAVQGGYLVLATTSNAPRHVELFTVSEDCVVGPTASVSYESTGVPAAASGASTSAVAWVTFRTYRLNYTVMSNNLCP